MLAARQYRDNLVPCLLQCYLDVSCASDLILFSFFPFNSNFTHRRATRHFVLTAVPCLTMVSASALHGTNASNEKQTWKVLVTLKTSFKTPKGNQRCSTIQAYVVCTRHPIHANNGSDVHSFFLTSWVCEKMKMGRALFPSIVCTFIFENMPSKSIICPSNQIGKRLQCGDVVQFGHRI